MTIRRAGPSKVLSWDAIEIGEDLGGIEGIISAFKIKAHAFAVDDYGDWYLRDSPFGGRIGHPTLLANDIAGLYSLLYTLAPGATAGLHTHNEMEFIQPVRLGQKVSVNASHPEKYQKRGRNYRVLEGVATDETGQPLVRMHMTEVVGFDPGTAIGQRTSALPPDAVTGEVLPGAPLVQRSRRDVPVGAVLPSLVKQTTLEQSIMFSGFPRSWVGEGIKAMREGIHTKPDEAIRRGQPDAIVQGLVSFAYLSELCTNFFGPSWLTSGRLSANFVKPVIVRDTLTVCGLVKRLEQGEANTRLHLDVWCRNQHGELVTVGRASCAVE